MKIFNRLLQLGIVVYSLATIVYADKFILIDLEMQMGYAYKDGDLVMSGRVSTGKENHRTPTGYYNILEKKRYHRSNLWPKPDGGARMDFMLRLTNTGIALHLGPVPKWPASHGCIRMKNGFAQELWHWASVGTEVEVSGEPPERYAQSDSQEHINDFFSDTYHIQD